MSNATDNLIEAEKMISSTITGASERKRTLEICKWLFLRNNEGNNHRIKCYTRGDKSVRFCIDRGDDCINDRIRTIFLTIKSDFQFGILSSTEKSYLKVHDNNSYTIPAPISRGLSDKEIFDHILDSYHCKMKKLGMSFENKDFSISTGSSIPSQTTSDGEIPTKESFETAYRILARPGESVSIDVILDQIEVNSKKDGKLLRSNWRIVTEKNIEIWAKNRCERG